MYDDALIPLNLERERGPKRMASEDAFNEYGPEGHGGDEKKGPRFSHPTIDASELNNLRMGRLEMEEKENHSRCDGRLLRTPHADDDY